MIPIQDQIKKWIKLSKHIVFTQDHSPIQDQIKKNKIKLSRRVIPTQDQIKK